MGTTVTVIILEIAWAQKYFINKAIIIIIRYDNYNLCCHLIEGPSAKFIIVHFNLVLKELKL